MICGSGSSSRESELWKSRSSPEHRKFARWARGRNALMIDASRDLSRASTSATATERCSSSSRTRHSRASLSLPTGLAGCVAGALVGREAVEDRVDEAGGEFAVERRSAEEQSVEDRPDQQLVYEPEVGVRAQVAAGDAALDDGP